MAETYDAVITLSGGTATDTSDDVSFTLKYQWSNSEFITNGGTYKLAAVVNDVI